MTVGNKIKARRLELELSVDEVADRINSYGFNKSRATIYRYESNDIMNMPITILEPLAKALETYPGYFMGWQDVDGNILNQSEKLDDWSDEELEEIENFKEFLKTKRPKQS